MKIKNISNSDSLICYSAFFSKTLIKNAFGLTILNNFKNFDGLLIQNCKIIHSFYMKFSFDPVFIDENNKVIALISGFKPFRISKYYKKSKYVLELPNGSIKKLNISINNVLSFE